MSDESSRMTTERHDGWLVGVPEQHRMSSAPLISMDDRVGTAHGANVHAIIVAREGVLVHERYFAGEDQIGRVPAGRVIVIARRQNIM
jgi:hypothetical protein